MKKILSCIALILMIAMLVSALTSCDLLEKLIYTAPTESESALETQESASETESKTQSSEESESGSVSSTESESPKQPESSSHTETKTETETESESETESETLHSHVYGDWQHDDQKHWKSCIGCEEKANEGTHDCVPCGLILPTFSENGSDSGELCEVCDKTFADGHIFPSIENTCGDYAYNALADHENGENLQKFYTALYNACVEFHTDPEADAELDEGRYFAFTVNYSSCNITSSEAFKVLHALREDCPIFYWIARTSTASRTYLAIYADDLYAEGDVRDAYNQTISEGIVGLVKPEGTAYDAMLLLHDTIIDTLTYAYEDDGVTPQDTVWAHNILGYFEYQSGVCETYVDVCQLFLNYWGIENMSVVGEVRGGNHTWNLVKMDDGKWYWFDLTWDDQTDYMNGRIYNYFCQTDAGFAIYERTIETEIYTPPERSESDYSGSSTTVGTTFKVDGLEFSVMGYNEVELIDAVGQGNLYIPETVTYRGRVYEVISIGRSEGNTLFPVFDDSILSVKIPATVRYIKGNAFYSNSIIKVSVAEDSPYLFVKDGTAIYQKDPCVLLYYLKTATARELTLQDGTVGIASWAFISNARIYTVILPNSIKFINSQAFYHCNSLSLIKFMGTRQEWDSISIVENSLPNCRVQIG